MVGHIHRVINSERYGELHISREPVAAVNILCALFRCFILCALFHWKILLEEAETQTGEAISPKSPSQTPGPVALTPQATCYTPEKLALTVIQSMFVELK